MGISTLTTDEKQTSKAQQKVHLHCLEEMHTDLCLCNSGIVSTVTRLWENEYQHCVRDHVQFKVLEKVRKEKGKLRRRKRLPIKKDHFKMSESKAEHLESKSQLQNYVNF